MYEVKRNGIQIRELLLQILSICSHAVPTPIYNRNVEFIITIIFMCSIYLKSKGEEHLIYTYFNCLYKNTQQINNNSSF